MGSYTSIYKRSMTARRHALRIAPLVVAVALFLVSGVARAQDAPAPSPDPQTPAIDGALTGLALDGEEIDFTDLGRRWKSAAERFVASARNRVPGQPGNDVMARRIAERFAAADVPSGVTHFEMPVFLPGKASVTVGGRRIAMHALLPNVADLGNFKQPEFDTRIVYVGRGTLDELNGKKIDGALCLFDFDCGSHYLDAMKLGARGCLFVEPDDYAARLAYEKILNVPFTVPRYRISRDDARHLIERTDAATAEGVAAAVEAEPNEWRRSKLTNHWALVKGADPEWSKRAVILHANYDTLHYCPGLPSGGTESMNLAVLMDLFEHYRRNPPRRSLLFMVYNGEHFYHAGASEMVAHLLGRPRDIFIDPEAPYRPGKGTGDVSATTRPSEEWVLRKSLAENIYYAEKYAELLDGEITQADIVHFRDTRAKPAGTLLNLKEPLARRIELKMHALRQRRLRLLRKGRLEGEPKREIDGALKRFGQLITLFNRYGRTSTWDELDADQRELFRTYAQRVVAHRSAATQRIREQLDDLQAIHEARAVLKNYQPIVALGLEAGYRNLCLSIRSGGMGYANDFADIFPQIYTYKRRQGNLFTNRVRTFTMEPYLSDLGIHWGTAGSATRVFVDDGSLPSVSFLLQSIAAWDFGSPYDPNSAVMGDGDTIAALSAESVGRKATYQARTIERILADEKTTEFLMEEDGEGWRSRMPAPKAGSAELITLVQDGSSVQGVQTRLPDTFVTLPAYRRPEFVSAVKGGMLAWRPIMSDLLGRAFVYNVTQELDHVLEAFHFDDEGRIDHALDYGTTGAKYKAALAVKDVFKDYHMVISIACRKADLYDLFDPKTHQPLEKPILQRASGSRVERYSQSGFVVPKEEARGDGYACLFYDRDLRVKTMLSDSVSLINATPENPFGVGYTVAELDRQSVPRLAAHDALVISRKRIELLRENAVRDRLVVDLQRQAEAWYYGHPITDPIGAVDDDGHDEALAPEPVDVERPLPELVTDSRRHLDVFRRTVKSYGAAFGSYPAVNATLADMMKAVVFYLAVLIPFCFFLQKLVFTFSKIQAQIAAFGGLFVVTYLIFHSVHPAFRVAETPQVILIAFVMLVLAAFVSLALKGKFDYHMENFKERFLSEEDVGVLKLAGTAMLVGVTNMKRRKLRTALTCLTIILVTFTMLSFTSISQRVSPTRIRKSDEAPYDGIFFARQSWLGLGDHAVDALTKVLGADIDGEPVRTLRRGFKTYKSGYETFFVPEGTTDDYAIRGILAVEPAEDGWLGPMPVVAGRFFESNEAREVLVTDTFARNLLKLDLDRPLPEDLWVRLGGVRVRVVGVLDSEAMKERTDLRGSSIVPQELAARSVNAREMENLVMEEEEVPAGTFRPVGSQFYVVVPYGIRHLLAIPTVSVSVKMPDPQAVWDRLTEYVYYSDNKVYFGATDRFVVMSGEDPVYERPGRYYLGSGFATSIGGLGSLIIPLLVAATIIFNTMLGAVYERKREIGIFNAIGLNPIHIAMFFFAEALVYGIVGGVSGYLIGQLTAKAITATGLMQDINLNYSSLSVVYVIMLSIVIVLLSSIYPAVVAMRTAVASSGRRAVTQQDADHLEVRFPFSFTRAMAVAANNYLKDYFDRHSDSSIGDFVATENETRVESDDGGALIMHLDYEVALSPYDLGVTQRVRMQTRFNEQVGAFMVTAEVERISGQESNWIATNKPFLNGIRKYLMQWRMLPAEGREAHLEEGMKRFGVADV